MGRVSVVVVAYNHRGYVADCVRALERAALPPGTRLILVDNASTDGTADLIRREVITGDCTRGGLPVLFIANTGNRGYSGGNNQAIERAMADGDEFVYLLNPDTEVERDFLLEACAAAGTDERIALVQSLLLRLPGGDVVNTWGNAIHYLGFGYAAGDGMPLAQASRQMHDIACASGAGVLMRLAILKIIGLLDDELFAYHEDLEISWRARLAGFRVVVAPLSRVGHKYEFSRSTRKLYLMERNRLLVLARCYRLPTLALTFPAFVAMESGLWLFALRSGWAKDKARAYGYVLDPRHWRQLARARRRVQALRTVSDREVTALFTGEVIFPAVSPWLLTNVGNPVLRTYWSLARRLLRW